MAQPISITDVDAVPSRTPKRNEGAPVPLSALLSVSGLLLVFLFLAPSLHSIDEVATVELFTHSVFFPLSLVIMIRFSFFVGIAFVSIQTVFFSPGWNLRASYIPASKLPNTTIKMKGLRTQFPYTSVTWNILGLSFGLSAYIGFMASNLGHHSISPMILRLALLSWETAAPNTLLVSAVVRYAIWPTALRHGSTVSLRSRKALLWHNANAAMALSEVALLGGLPLHGRHFSVAGILGCNYVLFSWIYMYGWKKEEGPNFIYWFFDTTIGKTSTFAIYALLGALCAFYGLFSFATFILTYLGGFFLIHLLFVMTMMALVCRFRDDTGPLGL